MGMFAFHWGDHELTMLQNGEKCDAWPIKPMAWDKDMEILRSTPEDNVKLEGIPAEENYRTWFGMSKKGRIVFLVDHLFKSNTFTWSPVDFLRGQMSPKDYAKQLSEFELLSMGLAFKIIVADINTNSMYCISKMNPEAHLIYYQEVGFGVHTLSSTGGFDIPFVRELRMKNLFIKIIGDFKKGKITQKEMATRFFFEPDKSDTALQSGKELYATVSTRALAMKPTKEVMVYERHLVNGEWRDQSFPFKME